LGLLTASQPPIAAPHPDRLDKLLVRYRACHTLRGSHIQKWP
jgi:hypothetical protein